MKLIVLCFVLVHAFCATAKPMKIKYPPLHLNRSCRILDLRGITLGIYPGEMCVFLSDGSFLSSTRKSLRYISKDDAVVWELAGHFHHQLKLSNDGARILALSSDKVTHEKKEYRSDKVMVISMQGKVLYERTSDALLAETSVPWLDWMLASGIAADLNLTKELSHFNSISEIPKIIKGHKNNFFKEGDIIVNAITQGVFILSPDLKTIRSYQLLSDKKWHYIHDVQANQRGNLLFFNNYTSDSYVGSNFSSIQEIEAKTKKIVFEFKASPKEMFFSKICGSVQEFPNGDLLIADNLNGTFIYSKTKKTITWAIRQTHHENGQRVSVQDVKGSDLTDFLAHRKDASF